MSRRTTRGRPSRAVQASIAETEAEAETGTEVSDETGSTSSSLETTSAGESESEPPTEYESTTTKTKSTWSLKKFIRSPYRTRSTSRSRTTVQAYQRSALPTLNSPTKALTFNESDEDDSSVEDVLSPHHRHARSDSGNVPPTPAEQEAHDDANIYMLDCCDSHEVRMPDGSIVFRPPLNHSHSHSHRSIQRTPSRQVYSSSSPPRTTGTSGRWLVFQILLAMIMVGLFGPWALKQIVHRPVPTFIIDNGAGGQTVMKDYGSVIEHLQAQVSQLRTDLDLSQDENARHLAEAERKRLADAATAAAAAAKVSSDVSAVKQQIPPKVDELALEKRLSEQLKKEVDQTERITLIQTSINILQQDLTSIQILANKAQETANEAKLKPTANPADIKDYSSDISSLQAKIVALQHELTELQSLKSDDGKVTFDAVALESRLTEHITRSVDPSDRLKAIQARIDELQAALKSVEELATKAKQLSDDHTTSKVSTIDYSAAIEFMKKSIAELKSELVRVELEGDVRDAASELRLAAAETSAKEALAALSALPDIPVSIDEIALQKRIADQLKKDLDRSDQFASIQTRLESVIAQLTETQTLAQTAQQAAVKAETTAQSKADRTELPTIKDYSTDLQTLNSKIQDFESQLQKAIDAAVANQGHTDSTTTSAESAQLSANLASLTARVKSLQTELKTTQTAHQDNLAQLAAAEKKIQEAATVAAKAAEAAAGANKIAEDATNAAKDASKVALDATKVAVDANKQAVDATQVAHAAVDAIKNAPTPTASSGTVDVASIRKEIDTALEKYSADRTGLVDYALTSSGGRVLHHSATHQVQLEGASWFSSFVSKCFMSVKKPEAILNDNMSVGSCWPMAGTNGHVSIGLRESIIPTHVSLQHIAASVAPDFTTTPKTFTVWGVNETEFKNLRAHSNQVPVGTNLGTFTYLANSTQLQTFQLTSSVPPSAFSIVTIGFESNYGNPSYTCIYRVRVHGDRTGQFLHSSPSTPSTSSTTTQQQQTSKQQPTKSGSGRPSYD